MWSNLSKSIIPRIRMDTLEGVHILFSSVIPLDTRPEATEIWRTAHHFGAKCYMELSRRITHVVAAKVTRSFYFHTHMFTLLPDSVAHRKLTLRDAWAALRSSGSRGSPIR